MTAILDTSSLLSLVKYYLPIDKTGRLKEIIESKYLTGEIKVIDKVIEECGYTAKGIILTELEFLNEKSSHIKTNDLLPNQAFFKFTNNEFCNTVFKKTQGLTDAEFERLKQDFFKGADAKLLLYAQHIAAEDPIIVTEESEHSNDGKLFKKIPSNCKHLTLKCCTLPELLVLHYNLEIKVV